MNTIQKSRIHWFPRSIQRRLPLSYAGIALLVALSLGGVLVSTLFEYYRQQEIRYLERNASIMHANLANMLENGEPIDNLQAQVNLFAFLSRTQIDLITPDDDLVVAADNLTSILSLDEATPGIRLVVRDMQQEDIWVGLPDDSLPTASVDLNFTNDQERVLVERVIAEQPGSQALPVDIIRETNTTTVMDHTLFFDQSEIIVDGAPGLFGFGLSEINDQASLVSRSSQVVTQPIYDSNNRILANLRLSQGPAYGVEIVTSVVWGWLLASLLSITLAVIVGYVISRNFSQPLHHLTSVTRQMTAGDLSARVNLRRDDELGKLASAFNAMAHQIEATVITLNHFVSDAAHEINTPITALRTNLELTTKDEINPKNVLTLQRALDQVIRLQHLTRSLLQLSRLESGVYEETVQSVNLSALIRDVADLYASRADYKDIELELSLPSNDIQYVAHEAHLQIALSNLIDNAIKFTPDNGRVSISMEKSKDTVMIHIRDTGVGIPPDHMPYIFNRFHRAPNVAAFDGSGLGLSIAQTIIHRYGGHISVKNLERGARFTIILT